MSNQLIKIRGLQRHYHMGEETVKALDGVDLDIQTGEFVMIIGSSGSGKSTLMHILGLLDTPDGGSLEYNGIDVAKMKDEELSSFRNRTVGFVFQQFNLLPHLTITENIALPLAYAGGMKDDNLEVAKVYASKMGLGERLGHKPTELSGGQNQRVAISRALVNNPDILMADEPTGALDSKTGQEIMEILHQLNREGKTIIMVTHDRELAETGTRKITMKDGEVIDDSGHSVLPPNNDMPKKLTENYGIRLPQLIMAGVREGLLPHKMRSFLTMLGIIIGVSSVICMSSFSLGSKKKQADQIRALGSNLVKLTNLPLKDAELNQARIRGSQGLSLKDYETLIQQDDIQAYSAVRETPMTVLNDGHALKARVRAVADNFLQVNNLKLSEGRDFDPFDQNFASKVCIVGPGIASTVDSPVIGNTLTLGGIPYTIVGILKNQNINLKGLESSGLKDSSTDIIIPLHTALTRINQQKLRSQLDEIQLQVKDENQLISSGANISKIIQGLHNGVKDFEIVIPIDLLRQQEEAGKLLDILTVIISSISMVVGGIGIMNIMLASVRERVREIGIRRATGASQNNILMQFLAESVILSATGGVFGVLLSLLVVFVTCSALDIPVVFSIPLLFISFAASMSTGLVFGLFPAKNAAQLNPVEALRSE
ncbi:ATP-binding cassette domain-containing protein [Lentisphaera profundi]|uniref:ATP-binding cassette domain-containing protein n=1 Tax=Lentisphaera profundi TaxID=1658616 RepID=A0ABY7VPS2_9BACT|nr:ATP-binding cassette domain-containing protein [Lentisphaera profundi]WDE96170.1 ATP-binding cassette domain-containing protein [Lentisphaera profundi]